MVRETFDGSFTFCHTGKSRSGKREQLLHFQKSLEEYGCVHMAAPQTWDDAFDRLKRVISNSAPARKVVFIDEMPWMDTARSGFLSVVPDAWSKTAKVNFDRGTALLCGIMRGSEKGKFFQRHVQRIHGGLRRKS